MRYEFAMLEGESWWGGSSDDGTLAPYNAGTELVRDFRVRASNQTMPMYLSDRGRCIWSEEPFACTIREGKFEIEGEGVTLETFGSTLREAYLGAMHKYFPPRGERPEADFFRRVQYNTWMQMTYNQTQEGVLSCARAILQNGFTPGILMIDEGWQTRYGDWTFDRLKFPDPKAMVEELHAMGFKVMLWVVPYVSADGLWFVRHSAAHFCKEKYFLRTKDGEIAILPWWNGYSAVFDLTKACDRELLDGQLRALREEYGIDGFKFDGGTLANYAHTSPVNGEANADFTAAQRNAAWNEFGTRYPYHEYKDTFKGGGKRSIQRLRDKRHRWEGEGLDTLIPNAVAAGLLGHPFICPDMVGGGEWLDRAMGVPVDQELFVRMAQCSALFPMMQFSWAPWEAVDAEHLRRIRRAHDLHNAFGERILRLVEDACRTGEPILRTLEYNYPHRGYAGRTDVFMLGEEILAAPVLGRGQTERDVPLPEGTWRGADGKIYAGGGTVRVPVSGDDLPYFEKI